jgi:hypothetical protein
MSTAIFFPDKSLMFSGFNFVEKNGYLRPHVDFNYNNKYKKYRTLNLLLYFNNKWKKFSGNIVNCSFGINMKNYCKNWKLFDSNDSFRTENEDDIIFGSDRDFERDNLIREMNSSASEKIGLNVKDEHEEEINFEDI